MFSYSTHTNKLPLSFDAWKLVQNDKAELIRICLKPGECIEPHMNAVPVIFYCISGKGNISAGERSGTIEEGAAVYIEPDISRALNNDGVEDLEVIVFKVM